MAERLPSSTRLAQREDSPRQLLLGLIKAQQIINYYIDYLANHQKQSVAYYTFTVKEGNRCLQAFQHQNNLKGLAVLCILTSAFSGLRFAALSQIVKCLAPVLTAGDLLIYSGP